ncbi:MAG: glycine cleavage system aminomethyltransferase GcvT [Alphaproteobacteria bacterium]|nr:glycine cleavage system aminomethyltransferase GcvT [Alphaproteobacteria bacterium]
MVEALRRTPLYDFHIEKGAKIVPFAGFEMPLQYAGAGIIAEHKHTREEASLFDVSHMGIVKIEGKDAAKGLETITPGDFMSLPVGKQKYSYFTNQDGGIVDDIMVANYGDFFIAVVNAGSRDADLAMMQEKLAPYAKVTEMADYALLALQGPKAREVLKTFAPDTEDMAFMDVKETEIMGEQALVSCSGYTGEDGFEIALPAVKAEDFAAALLDNPVVKPAGLGARDTLRLEAGLPLHGNDIDANTTPVEAGLAWAISQRRRKEGGFPGEEVILAQIANGTDLKLVGICVESRVPVRSHAVIKDENGDEEIGMVTSGSFGATLNAPVALGYIDPAFAADGVQVKVVVHGNLLGAKIVKLPFVPHNYVRK